MGAAAPAKFTFDLDLTETSEKARLIGERKLSDMLETARQEGYDRGCAEGGETAAAKAAEAIAAAAAKLAASTAQLAEAGDRSHQQMQADAAQLAVATARKLSANLIARQPLVEIEALMRECLSALGNVPHLVIRCHPDLSDRIKLLAEQHMQTSGFSGRLVVMGEPEIMLGDARFEWVEGGLVRDLNTISAEIDRKLADYLKSNGAPGTGETDNG